MIRLLERDKHGKLTYNKFKSNSIPAFAILSHTWNIDDSQEVVFGDDLNSEAVREKEGYSKILFCAHKADKAGLRYFWIDTCCINKEISEELQEAIISMFRWYNEATRCFVYLSDVSASHEEIASSSTSWQSAFRKSRWFKRGWTLQELIAPKSVEFFTKDGIRLGDKASLESMIQEITRIDKRALRGRPLSEFSIKERKSWTQCRETTKEEDSIYCLLGIFDVSMPALYGEGMAKAERRLDIAISHYGTVYPSEGELEGKEIWAVTVKSRMKEGRCLNCGSAAHWENNCSEACGKCFILWHTASTCIHPVRCLICRNQGHMAMNCPNNIYSQNLGQSFGSKNYQKRNGYSNTESSLNHNPEHFGSASVNTQRVEASLAELARHKTQYSNWRDSIVDVLGLLGLQSSLKARKHLAEKLHVRNGPAGSGSQNTALRKALVSEIAINDGRIPSRICECSRCGGGHQAMECPN